jgi:SAM-dependent methyltransferase
MELREHERLYYTYQTEARGLATIDQLEAAFKKMSATYGYYFGHYLRDIKGPAVDVPCGYGNFLYFLRQRGIECYGVDLDDAQVALAQSLGLPARKGDGLVELKAKHGLGLISSLDFLEHIDKDDAVRFLRDARQALRPGGLLILRMPSADGPFGAHDFANDLTHRWVATSTVLRHLLGATGFELLDVHDDYPAPVHFKGLLRFCVYHVSKRLFSLGVIALGMSAPKIWSRSMWIVARRPSEA